MAAAHEVLAALTAASWQPPDDAPRYSEARAILRRGLTKLANALLDGVSCADPTEDIRAAALLLGDTCLTNGPGIVLSGQLAPLVLLLDGWAGQPIPRSDAAEALELARNISASGRQ